MRAYGHYLVQIIDLGVSYSSGFIILTRWILYELSEDWIHGKKRLGSLLITPTDHKKRSDHSRYQFHTLLLKFLHKLHSLQTHWRRFNPSQRLFDQCVVVGLFFESWRILLSYLVTIFLMDTLLIRENLSSIIQVKQLSGTRTGCHLPCLLSLHVLNTRIRPVKK